MKEVREIALFSSCALKLDVFQLVSYFKCLVAFKLASQTLLWTEGLRMMNEHVDVLCGS